MLKSVIFDSPYDEASLRSLIGAFEPFPSVKIQQIAIRFASHPTLTFEFTGPTVDNLVAQANTTKDLLAKIK